ncbi:MAG: IclR family transcriptional regulator [Anaerolineae bacterium]
MLETFLDGEDRLTLAQISRDSGLSKNKTFRILSTLEKHRLVKRDEVGAYHLGVRFLDFGQRVRREMGLLEASRPVLDWLVEQTRETVFLGVVDGSEALCVDMRESPQSIRLFAEVGRRAPLYTGGVPKVLLAFLPEEERDAMLETIELKPITPHTITDRRTLEKLLRVIRNQGYIVTADDLDVGAHSIAAPILDHRGKVIAAISVAGPSNRFTDEHIQRYVKLIRQGAAQISRALGYRGSYPTAGSHMDPDFPSKDPSANVPAQ